MDKNIKMSKKVSIEECRKILSDYKSTDEVIKKRLEFLEVFCRNIIRLELESCIKDNYKIN